MVAGRGRPPKGGGQVLEGHVGPFERPTASTSDVQFFSHGYLSRQHRHAFWFERPVRVRGTIVSLGSQSYYYESWNSESCIIGVSRTSAVL